MKDNRG